MKIRLPMVASGSLHVRQEGACSDYVEVKNTANLSFPDGFQTLSKPWERPGSKVINSMKVTEGFERLLQLEVPGLGGTTVRGVMDALRSTSPHGHCLSFPFGGSVRDQFLGTTTKDIDMEVSCMKDTILSTCMEHWPGERNCREYGSGVVHIGDPYQPGQTDDIDSKYWNDAFFGSATTLEYTANSLAYDANPGSTSAVFDITGHGVNDACQRIIRIPVESNMWPNWNSHYQKLYRFWKLRAKGFKAVDDSTKNFIVQNTMSAITNSPTSFQTFFCIYALGGIFTESTTRHTCTPTDCSTYLSRRRTYETLFAEDFTGVGDFWNSVAANLIENLNFDCPQTGTSNASSVLLNNGTWFKLSLLLVITVCFMLYW